MTRNTSFGPLVSFIIIIHVFTSTNHLTGILKLRMYLWEATTKRTGPNDAFRVVWAISKFYYYYLCFLYLLIIYLISIGAIEVIKLCRGYG